MIGGNEHVRQLTAALAVAGVCLLTVGCSNGGNQGTKTSTSKSTTTTTTAPPLPDTALPGLLLGPEQVNAAMGATEMAVTKTHFAMSDDSATMEPRECLAIDGSVQAQVYADSGFTAERDQTLQEGDNFTHYVQQAVVLFPSAKQGRRLLHRLRPTVAGLPPLHPHPVRLAVGRRADIQHGRHTEHHCDSAERQGGRVGLWAGTGATKQRRYRRQHMQRQPRGLGGQYRQPDRRQSAHLMRRLAVRQKYGRHSAVPDD